MSVDGDPVDGYYPVTFQGVSGWTATGLVQVANDGVAMVVMAMAVVVAAAKTEMAMVTGGNRGTHHENGNGGTETVSADPVYSDGSEPVEAAPSSPSDTPVSGGTYGPGGGGYSEDQIVGIIYEAADNYGQSPDDMLRVARCESSLNPSAVSGGGAITVSTSLCLLPSPAHHMGHTTLWIPGRTRTPQAGCGPRDTKAIGPVSSRTRSTDPHVHPWHVTCSSLRLAGVILSKASDVASC